MAVKVKLKKPWSRRVNNKPDTLIWMLPIEFDVDGKKQKKNIKVTQNMANKDAITKLRDKIKMEVADAYSEVLLQTNEEELLKAIHADLLATLGDNLEDL